MKKVCAIYTRKSTDERLDMEFNTLDAQREACAAYILSQKSEGWSASKEHYDDGGFSGGSLDRPALNKLITDIKAGKIHVIVVYKIDRLTRSLMDFAKLVDIFDEYGVTFVSVTQSFNTTTSMGRLTLKVLLSFAQFEREVTGERIRDKIAASKAKGMWMGGKPPLGFDIENRRLIINEEDAPKAKLIFELYLKLGCVHKLKQEVDKQGIKSRKRISVKKGLEYGGKPLSRGALYSTLKNPVYIGKISHKGKIHEGDHPAIINKGTWQAVQEKLQKQDITSRPDQNGSHQNLLTKLIFDESGKPYVPTFTIKKNKRYRYYLNEELARNKNHPNNAIARLPAHEIETTIEQTVRKNLLKFIQSDNYETLNHIEENQQNIATYKLIQACVKRAIITRDSLKITLTPEQISPLIYKYLKLKVSTQQETITLNVPYQTKRIRNGAMIIKSQSRENLDAIPKTELKRLIQGIIWRDEHFAGAHIQKIAERENYSSRYVRNMIMKSLEV
ncbi:MAG: recombinase family protein [Pseudomonadota bacterium]|nr:recombinase family protein [Pseudomonadota bacterium]